MCGVTALSLVYNVTFPEHCVSIALTRELKELLQYFAT